MGVNPSISFQDRDVTVVATSNGQAAFNFDFPVYDGLIQLDVHLNGALKTPTTHYTVSGNEVAAGGTITFQESVAATVLIGDEVRIRGYTRISRTSKYAQEGDFKAYSVNRDLDLLVMIAQEIRRDTDQHAIILIDHGDRIEALEVVAIGNGNFIVASQLEAQTGVNNTKGMTPLRSEEHFAAALNRTFDAVSEEFPTKVAGGQGNVALYNTAYRFELTTDSVYELGAGTLKTFATVSILRRSMGINYSDPSSVNKSDVPLIVQYVRGLTTDDYLDDTSLGQGIGFRVDCFAPSHADGGCIVGQVRHVYVAGPGAQTGAVSGVEIETDLRDRDGVALLSISNRMGSAPPHDNVAVDWIRSGHGYHTKITVDDTNYRMDSGFFLEDSNTGGNIGAKNVISARNGPGNGPYFSITGLGDADAGGGCARFAVGSEAFPGIAFQADKNTGIRRGPAADQVMGVAGGVDCGSFIGGAIKMEFYTVAEALALTVVVGGWIYVTNEVGGGTPAWGRGSEWLRCYDETAISA